MCGIAGAWGGPSPHETVLSMTADLAHRGPDGAGTWEDRARGLALGHRRLAILDLSSSGAQPMASRSGRYHIVYNGEVYNFRELRAELDLPEPRSGSDTEVLLEACAAVGVERAVRGLNGMFAFGLWDAAEATLWLVRDRLGIKPLYYCALDGRLLFASELRALRRAIGARAEVDARSLALYLRYGYVPGSTSIFAGVRRLPPGHILSARRRADGTFVIEERAYWSVFDHVGAPAERLDEREAIARLDALLGDAVRARLVADVPVGAFLSGGVDSSAIVALMCEAAAGRVKTFSIGFDEKRFDESVYARAVATALGTDHHEHIVSAEEALALVGDLGDLYTEPFADPSQIPTILVSRLARRHVTVALSGDGGDELFGGYRHYAFLERAWKLAARVPSPLLRAGGRALRAGGRRLRVAGSLDLAKRHLVRAELLGGFFEGAAHSVEALYEAFMDHWRGEQVVLGARNRPLLPVVRGARALDPRVQMMLRDLLVYLPDDILTKVDRASMSCGLEARVPLLDYRVVELVSGFPLDLRVRGDTTKWALRRVLYARVSPSLIERPKMGFSIPLAEWLRGPLRPWAEELLAPQRLRDDGFFDPAVVRRVWSDHVELEQDWSTQLWDVLMFQSWLAADRLAATRPPAAQTASTGA